MRAVDKAKDAVEDLVDKAKEAANKVTGGDHDRDAANETGTVAPAIDLIDESRGAPEPGRERP